MAFNICVVSESAKPGNLLEGDILGPSPWPSESEIAAICVSTSPPGRK
jgi:hypothetical protein